MVDPSEQDAQTTGDRLIIVLLVVVFAVMTSLLAVGLRLWCRRKIRALGWDDFAAVMTCLCIVGYGSGILACLSDPSGMLPFHKISNFYKCSYFILFLYSQALFFAKMAFVLLYYRIVALPHWRWTYIAAITFLVLWNVSGILYHFLQCTPMSTIWDPAVVGKCVPHQMEVGYVLSGINIFTDFVVAILPLPVIWKLNLRRSQKIALSGIFLLACFLVDYKGDVG
ncbi:uncharacterized protein FIESC28_02897 [Fusarium coffeatum]|uniref:Rhodopsin domain-containing protein n=1 Tax=Fusarium coffeatum TaxID=231269 RepID=A0A366S4Z4_9HYPO|nr:uncharacterized protein FIESC28_02897 [Fusarium coffeatum]RBR24407.1 hypothetical protein FIESC28_02897 [Fusarium coffeatum]